MLDGALAAGIPLPHSCRRGDCGQCAALVVSSGDASLSPGHSALLCRVSSAFDGAFDLDEDPAITGGGSRLFPARVDALEKVTENIVRLVLRTPPGAVLAFRGGQYANLRLRNGVERSYSIFSVDAERRTVEFFIKVLPEGAFGRWLRSDPAGEMVQMRGPFGSFMLKLRPVDETWLIGTGTGIVPLFSMLAAAEPDRLSAAGRIRLLWGNRLRSDLFIEDRLKGLCDRTGAELSLVFSREDGARGSRVTDHLVATRFETAAVYAAGHPEMVSDVKRISSGNGVVPRNFHADPFVSVSESGAQL